MYPLYFIFVDTAFLLSGAELLVSHTGIWRYCEMYIEHHGLDENDALSGKIDFE